MRATPLLLRALRGSLSRPRRPAPQPRCLAADASQPPTAATEAAETAPSPAAAPGAAGGRVSGTATPERSAAAAELVDTQPPRGTRDFPPDEMRLRNWLFGHFREVSLLFGFEEWDAPVVESEQLYTRKAGEEITQQLYSFEDKGGRRLALRPELTPSLARLVLAKGRGLALPAKWFAIGQCWRYERMSRGRRREHYQWNMDIVGVAGIAAEAELLSAVATLLRRLGLGPDVVAIRVSSRKVLHALLEAASVPAASFAPACVILDKSEKLPRGDVVAELASLGIPETAADSLLSGMALRSVGELEGLLGEGHGAVADMRLLWRTAEAAGFAPYLEFDASVVRGLAYYTGLVFEVNDRAGALRAIAGGGRYDRLLSAYGGPDAPCCGFGFGDAVIVELLRDRGLLPQAPSLAALSRAQDWVAPADGSPDAAARAAELAAGLRAAGRRVDLQLEPHAAAAARDPAKARAAAAKRAAAAGAGRLLTAGADGAVAVRDLAAFADAAAPTVAAALALPPPA